MTFKSKRIIQITDLHIKNEEPFFRAAVTLYNYIIMSLKNEQEPFIFLDGGDHFHISKETGRVNNEVVTFFLRLAAIPQCEHIFVMQGNHDVKEETGSALDVLKNLNDKIQVIEFPYLFSKDMSLTADNPYIDNLVYLLPHMKPFSYEGYSDIKSYGDEDFHRNYWKPLDWDTIKNNIKFVSFHGGDETTGKLFMNADISFIPGIRSNGHIHKQISNNHLPSITITRRDEVDKLCFIRYIDMDKWEIRSIGVPLFLNYAQIAYGEDLDDYFRSGLHTMPGESLIVDIYGHDDKDLVIKEYTEKWKNRVNPKIYIGEVTPVERKGEAVLIDKNSESDFNSINIKELFIEFSEEKKLSKSISDDLISRIA